MRGPEHWLYRLRLRLPSLFRHREVERDLQDEMAFHLAMQAEANRQAGLTERDADRAALRRFGGVAQQQEACRDHIFGWIEGIGRDLRYAARALRRRPARETRRAAGSSLCSSCCSPLPSRCPSESA